MSSEPPQARTFTPSVTRSGGPCPVTTVGYGDKFPVTGQGRLIAAAVMLTGIAVLGVVTAAVATWFVETLRTIESEEAAGVVRTERLEDRLSEVLQRLARVEALLGSDPTQPPSVGAHGQ